MPEPLTFFAPAARGLEPLLAGELAGLGAVGAEVARGGVRFQGTLEAGYRACLWSRLASRILLSLGSFPAPSPEALYQGIRNFHWAFHLGPDQTLAVDFSATRSAITHSHYGALKVKDAIVDQLREELGARPSVRALRPDVQVNVHLDQDVATASIDLSGESLHRRGYREEGALAPLKESLAAGLLALAEWPRFAEQGSAFLDPLCGSGTLPIEAALWAARIAPGIRRTYFGFLGWRGHDRALWAQLLEEAREGEVRDPRRLPPIAGYDADARAVRAALANVERAGLRGRVHIERRELASAQPLSPHRTPEPPGLVLTNPPYGERLGEAPALGALYQQLGDVLKQRFAGWEAHVFTGNLDLVGSIGLRPARRHVLFNGPIECRLLRFPLLARRSSADAAPRPRAPVVLSPEVEAFANRLRKNARHGKKWAQRQGITCYRVYDRDLPEYAVAVDLYERWVHVQEYEPPATVDARKAERRLRELLAVIPEVLGVLPDDVFVKTRRRQRGRAQYERFAATGSLREVREGGLRFWVNFEDHLDTGLFLDHRTTRALVGELARGRRFLNLFAYTGTASVYAAHGGAASTTAIDLSKTYLDWAQKNLALNGFWGPEHELVRADCLSWLSPRSRQFDLIFLDPPTFSTSKKMARTFDVQRDHVELLRTVAKLLAPGGILLFSTNCRTFKLSGDELPELHIEDLTARTLPEDFARSPKVHKAYRITRA